MKPLDRVLQRWRMAKARPFIPPGSRVLDISSADGALFQHLHGRIREGLGIDPRVTTSGEVAGARLVRGFFSAGHARRAVGALRTVAAAFGPRAGGAGIRGASVVRVAVSFPTQCAGRA